MPRLQCNLILIHSMQQLAREDSTGFLNIAFFVLLDTEII